MSTMIDQIISEPHSLHLDKPRSLRSSKDFLVEIDKANGSTVICYENNVPEFVEAELIRLYNNFYSSLSHLRSKKIFENASTYVQYDKGEITSLFLYRLDKNIVTVLNEIIEMSKDEMTRFSQYIFHRYINVSAIRFCAIENQMENFEFPFQRHNYLEDIVITLPQNTEQYIASLDKSLRRNLRRCKKKLGNEHSSLSFRVSSDSSANESDIRDVIELNRVRMIEKNKRSAIDEEETKKRVIQVRENGLICVATIDGKICAGAICFRTGDNYFLTVIAHDSAYDAYSLGMLCCANMIDECIARGGKEFHFLWGRYDYKFALGGIQRDLFQIAIYRSKLHLVSNFILASSIFRQAKIRQIFLYLQNMKKENSPISRRGMQIINFIRQLKKS
jgi:hypothetical protein